MWKIFIGGKLLLMSFLTFTLDSRVIPEKLTAFEILPQVLETCFCEWKVWESFETYYFQKSGLKEYRSPKEGYQRQHWLKRIHS